MPTASLEAAASMDTSDCTAIASMAPASEPHTFATEDTTKPLAPLMAFINKTSQDKHQPVLQWQLGSYLVYHLKEEGLCSLPS